MAEFDLSTRLAVVTIKFAMQRDVEVQAVNARIDYHSPNFLYFPKYMAAGDASCALSAENK